MKKWQLFLLISLILIAIDALVKAYIHTHIPLVRESSPFFPYGGVPVFHRFCGIDFCIVHVINKGAAWGAFSSMQHYLLIARILIIGALTYILLTTKTTLLRMVSLSLIIAGAMCNVIDFFIYGHVVDMFLFRFGSYSYPVFNIADSAIFIGIVLLTIKALSSKLHKPEMQP